MKREYVTLRRSAADIAGQFGITEAAILFWLRKHNIPRRSVREIRAMKHWGAMGSDNPMWNRRGEANPNWRGGGTPERQAFYASAEWRTACSAVWKRDNATCRRCGMHRDYAPDVPFHIHHVIPFGNREHRASVENLVLLCEICHRFVHSRRNTSREYLPEV